MARRSGHRHRTARREVSTPSLTLSRLLAPPQIYLPRAILPVTWQSQLPQIEDRRLWHPDPLPPAKSLVTPNHRLAVKPSGGSRVPSRIVFSDPQPVICARRQIRKEVLHALKRTGADRGPRRRPRRGAYTGVSC